MKTFLKHKGIPTALFSLVIWVASTNVAHAGLFEWSMNQLVKFIGNLLLSLFGLIEVISAHVFDYAITHLVLQMDSLLNSITVIDELWVLFRDLANIVFIFAILYAAIGLILNLRGFNLKRMLPRIVVVALLVNFSLFFTTVIVDVSNIIALQFHEATVVRQAGELGTETSISAIFKSNLNTLGVESIGLDSLAKTAVVTVMGSAFLLLTAGVFFAASMLLVTRTIVIIFLMIFSPLAFVALITPKMKKYWNQWLNTLLNWSFFAPIFLAMIFVVVKIISTGGIFQHPGGMAEVFAGNSSDDVFLAMDAFIAYALVTGMMIASIVIAKSMGGSLAAKTVSGTSNAITSTLALTGRNTLGRMGRAIRQSEAVQRLSESDSKAARMAGRIGMRTGDAMAKGTYDVRNTNIADTRGGNELGLGRGTRKTRERIVSDKERKEQKFKKMLEEGRYSNEEADLQNKRSKLEQQLRQIRQMKRRGEDTSDMSEKFNKGMVDVLNRVSKISGKSTKKIRGDSIDQTFENITNEIKRQAQNRGRERGEKFIQDQERSRITLHDVPFTPNTELARQLRSGYRGGGGTKGTSVKSSQIESILDRIGVRYPDSVTEEFAREARDNPDIDFEVEDESNNSS